MSEEEFFKFCAANPELNVERDKNGTMEVMSPVGHYGSLNEMHAAAQLYNWNLHANAGYVFNSSVGFTLPDGAVRSPDASWVQKERHDALSTIDKQKFAHICPDFLIEIRSASDNLPALKTKMSEYMINGCRLAWLIDPLQQKTWIYEADRPPVEISGFEQKLYGGDVLPGFEMDLSVFVS
jgi:Uma2 family endonuclease